MSLELVGQTFEGGTQVIESRLQKRINRRVFAGAPRSTGHWQVGADDVARRLLTFAPGDRFGFDLWAANEFGSTRWRVVICEALNAGEQGDLVPDVRPFITVLADVSGASRVKAFMAWLQTKGDDLKGMSADGWESTDLYFNRAPLVRLKGLVSGLSAGLYGQH